MQDKTNWQATLTGRLGYAWERTLFYVKGGVAFEDSSTTVNCIFGPTGRLPLLVDRHANRKLPVLPQSGRCRDGRLQHALTYTRVGGTVGFGTEFDLGHNWSAKSEYDFMSFDRHTAIASDGTSHDRQVLDQPGHGRRELQVHPRSRGRQVLSDRTPLIMTGGPTAARLL